MIIGSVKDLSVAADDIGTLVLDVLTGTVGNYAGTELVNLRRTLQQRFSRTSTYENFAKNPDDRQAQRMLRLAVNLEAERDASFNAKVADHLHAITVGPAIAYSPSIGRDGAAIGSISGTGHTLAVGKRVRIGNNTYPMGGVIGAILVFAALLAIGCVVLNSRGSGDNAHALTKDSTCGDFMAEAPEVRDEAVRRIAKELKQTQRSMDRLNVESTCGEAPSQSLGNAIMKVMPPSE